MTKLRVFLPMLSIALVVSLSFVVKGDVLGILSSQGQWLEAEYYSADKAKFLAKGWVKMDETAEIAPPVR